MEIEVHVEIGTRMKVKKLEEIKTHRGRERERARKIEMKRNTERMIYRSFFWDLVWY